MQNQRRCFAKLVLNTEVWSILEKNLEQIEKKNTFLEAFE